MWGRKLLQKMKSNICLSLLNQGELSDVIIGGNSGQIPVWPSPIILKCDWYKPRYERYLRIPLSFRHGKKWLHQIFEKLAMSDLPNSNLVGLAGCDHIYWNIITMK